MFRYSGETPFWRSRGCSVSHKDRLEQEGCDLEAIGRALVNNYVHQILDVGTFHADPHQGNIMVSKGKPYWIDFGMIGKISRQDINNIQSIILSVINGGLKNFPIREKSSVTLHPVPPLETFI